jgi:hypothetical protein
MSNMLSSTAIDNVVSTASKNEIPPRPGTPLGFLEQDAELLRYKCSPSPSPPPIPLRTPSPCQQLSCEDAVMVQRSHELMNAECLTESEDITYMLMEAVGTNLLTPSPPPQYLESIDSLMYAPVYIEHDGLLHQEGSKQSTQYADVSPQSCTEHLEELHATALIAPQPVSPVPCAAAVMEESVCLHSRPKFSAPPSPLSPNGGRALTPLTPPRHNYAHRGYSRHALTQTKWFWQAREEEWSEYTANLRFAGSCQDFQTCAQSLQTPATRWQSRVTTACSSPMKPPSSPVPPMSVHPRWGDASVLRDPYCAHMDRYFVSMPMHTLRKAIWMFDVHLGLERASYPPDERLPIRSFSRPTFISGDDSDSDDDNISCEDLMCSSFTSLSDDSESTLVESEGEGSPFHETDITIEQVEVVEDEDYFEIDIDTPRCDNSHKYPESDNNHAGPVPSSSKSPSTAPYWETAWFRRLELLLSITQVGQQQRQTLPPF